MVQPSIILMAVNLVLPFLALVIMLVVQQGVPTVAASTCEVLEELASNPGNDDVECSTNEACNGVNCAANLIGNGDYRASAVILSCNDPPAVKLTIIDPSSTVLLDDTFDRSRSVRIPTGFFGLQVTLSVTVEQLSNAIGIQIDAIPPPLLGQGTIAVIEYTVIPINSSQCGSPAAPTTSSTVVSTTSSTVASTTSSTVASTTPSIQNTDAETPTGTEAPTGIESTDRFGGEVEAEESGADKPSEIVKTVSMATALFILFLTY